VVAEVRKDEQNRLKEEGREEEAKALKKTKYILTSNPKTLEEKDKAAAEGKRVSKPSVLFNIPELKAKGGLKERYDTLIKENELFLTIDIVKAQLDQAYKETDPEKMKTHITEIINTCIGTENKHFEWFAKLLKDHFDGIVSHAIIKISTNRLEGFNNAIKTERRQGFGYPDDEYFFLRLIDRSHMNDRYN
jgi:transposase